MKNPAQTVAEYSAAVEQAEKQYVAVRDGVQYSLQKAMEIRHAILTYEMELAQALVKLDTQLRVISDNYAGINR